LGTKSGRFRVGGDGDPQQLLFFHIDGHQQTDSTTIPATFGFQHQGVGLIIEDSDKHRMFIITVLNPKARLQNIVGRPL
jgi:hypothetical protein